MDEELIRLVRDNDALYDINNANYVDFKLRAEIWNNIGIQLNKKGTECKRRWISLRNQYGKVLKGKTNKNWKFSGLMEFLKSHMKEKPRLVSSPFKQHGPREDKEVAVKNDVKMLHIKMEESMTSDVENLETTENIATPDEKKESKTTDEDEALNLFFDTMKKTVGKFSPQDQHVIKCKIFNLISETEATYLF